MLRGPVQPGAPGQQSGQGSPYSALRFASSGAAAAEEGRSPQLELPPPPPLRFEFSWRKLWRCALTGAHLMRQVGRRTVPADAAVQPFPGVAWPHPDRMAGHRACDANEFETLESVYFYRSCLVGYRGLPDALA